MERWTRETFVESVEEPEGCLSGASLSGCGTYRWTLWRTWDAPPFALFVMLNPSTADASEDDPTIRRCKGFAESWGCGGVVVANLFAYRATDPKDLLAAHKAGVDVVGELNDAAIASAVDLVDGGPVVCAWGTKGTLLGRDKAALRFLREGLEVTPHALRLTKAGHPSHPLYLPKALTPEPMR